MVDITIDALKGFVKEGCRIGNHEAALALAMEFAEKAAQKATELEAQAARLRDALEKIRKTASKGFKDRQYVALLDVRKLVNEAIGLEALADDGGQEKEDAARQ